MEYWSILMSIIVSIVISALAVHYHYRNFNIFKRHGVIHVPSVPILGGMIPVILRRMTFVDITQKIYNFNRDAKYIGFYMMTRPILVLRDPELITTVVVKNSNIFLNRPFFDDFNEHVLAENLFALQNEKWQVVRNLLARCFTSNKMKRMFTLTSKRAEDLAKFMSTLPTDKKDVDMKDVFDKYANDIIALCFYGFKMDSVRDPTNKFLAAGRDITYMSAIRTIKCLFIRSFPNLGRILDIKLINNPEMKYFENSIKNEVTIRETEHVTCPDMIQMMMDYCRNKKNRVQFDKDDIVAQAYAIYFGGFETSSSVTSFIAYKLATNPRIQIKLRQEVDNLLYESDGNVTYDAVNELTYLHAVVQEGLRYFTSSISERVCDGTYELPPALPGGKPFIISKGMTIWIPIYAIHHDEKYYDNPEEFYPERFLNNKHDNQNILFFPFGMGPKTCIGRRFAVLMIKIMLFHLLARCELKPCDKTHLKFSKKSVLMIPVDGFWLNVQRRDDIHPAMI